MFLILSESAKCPLKLKTTMTMSTLAKQNSNQLY